MDTSALYKHDRISLAQYTSNLRQQLMISGNEVRELHGLKPMEGLDDDFNPHMKDQSQEAPEEIEEYETVPEQEDLTQQDTESNNEV